MEPIELWNGTAKALISQEGAWLINLSDENGDILFPKRQLMAADGAKKARGGAHVCLPNFGPGGESGLAQHGFGRVSEWKVVEHDNTIAVFELDGGDEPYDALRSTLSYTLFETAITLTLDMENTATGELRVAPGFHPYFMLQAGETEVKVGDVTYKLADIGGTEFVTGESLQLQTAARAIELTSINLPTWAIWTDQLGSYVCVEPTAAGNAFLNEKPADEELLQPGEVKTYSCTISW